MKVSGKITATTLKKILQKVRPGISCIELDRLARQEIEKKGALPAFPTIEDYKWTICTNLNEQVVHGIPTSRKVKDGDILKIDIGAIYQGFHSDMAISIGIGQISQNALRFLEVGKKTLQKAIAQAKIASTIGDISRTIQENIEGAGYSIVKSLSGHGIGRQLHEDPMVPGFGQRNTGPRIRQGMTLAIEVIYAQRSGEVYLEKDGWTISTHDGSLAGLFEQTIAVTKNGPIVLTPYL